MKVLKFGSPTLSKPESKDVVCQVLTSALELNKQIVAVLAGEDSFANEVVTACEEKGISAKKLSAEDFFSNDCSNDFIASTIKDDQLYIIATQVDASNSAFRKPDYLASKIAAALNASELELLSNVDGIMTADPQKVKQAFSLVDITPEEALELSHFGVQVIHPPSLQPALDKKIPIRVRNAFNKDFSGTRIVDDSIKHPTTITAVSSIDDISFLNVQGTGMVGVSGSASRLFGALAKESVNVILITQASSEHTICFAVRPDEASVAKKLIEEEFAEEISQHLIKPVVVKDKQSIVSVVGQNMQLKSGVSAKVFGALGRNGINITAIAQGSSELNISVVVDSENESKALNALHEEFFLAGSQSLNLYVAGVGLIGKALLEQIKENTKSLRESLSLDLRVVAVANSKKLVFNDEGIDLNSYQEQLSESDIEGGIDNVASKLIEANLQNSVLVDCSAFDGVGDSYIKALGACASVVTPNKKAQTADSGLYNSLMEAARSRNATFLYETSVGAGLPVISTLTDLIRSGDKIQSIEAVLSGTLSYIFNSYTGEKSFSEVVKIAKESGFTEPDPRDDLNGMDVARKILILARETGLELEIDDVSIGNLVPESCRGADSVEEFFDLLEKEDEAFEAKRKAAEDKGCKLCYIASLKDGVAKTSLEEVGPDHPFFSLSGSDNIISFTTERYNERPLVVKGPGAGAEVTAAGVFADIIRIANYQ